MWIHAVLAPSDLQTLKLSFSSLYARQPPELVNVGSLLSSADRQRRHTHGGGPRERLISPELCRDMCPQTAWNATFPPDAADSISFKESMNRATNSLGVVLEEEEEETDRFSPGFGSAKPCGVLSPCSLRRRHHHSRNCQEVGSYKNDMNGKCSCFHTGKRRRRHFHSRRRTTPMTSENAPNSLIEYLHSQNSRVKSEPSSLFDAESY